MNLQFDLNKQQRKAVETTEGPVLVLAGAGSGKTRALTYRIAYLIAEGVEPEDILTLTFTNKAANDMSRKVEELLEDKEVSDRLWMGTFHSVCLRILRKNLDKIGYEDNFIIYDQDESEDITKTIINELGLSTDTYETGAIYSLKKKKKMELLTPEELSDKKEGEYYDNLGRIYRKYEKRLRRDNAFDFTDLIKKTIELFRQHPDVLKHYQNKFEYVQIDEYQDTNHSQYTIATMLAQPSDNIFVVGDDYQSIYAFRGADISNILEFDEDYPNAKVVRLERNYRSAQNIIEASNSVIANNKGQSEKNVWTNKNSASSIMVCEAENEQAEADFVSKTIRSLVNSNQYTYDDIAVLYRCNYQSRAFEKYLVKYKIPHQIVGNVGFFDRAEIKDILSMVNLMINPNHLMSLTRLVGLKSNGIGGGTLSKVHEYASNQGVKILDVLEKLEDIKGVGPKTAERITGFYREMVKPLLVVSETNKPIPGKIKEALQRVGYTNLLKKKRENFQDRMENVNELIRLSYHYYNKDKTRDLQDFMRDVKLMSQQDDIDDEDNDSVKLMTVHASKGLEFPVVFLVGMEENTFPFELALAEGGEEEERRLCYVGMTRAEERLFISHREWVEGFTGYDRKEKSRFLKEIPMSLTKNLRHESPEKNYRYKY